MIVTTEMIRKELQQVILQASLDTLEPGKLGKHVPESNTLIFVKGKPGMVWVTRRDQTTIEAKVKGRIVYVEDYPVEFRDENGTYVIYGKSVHPSMKPVNDDLLIDRFSSLRDVNVEGAEQGNLSIYNAFDALWTFIEPGLMIGGAPEKEPLSGTERIACSDQDDSSLLKWFSLQSLIDYLVTEGSVGASPSSLDRKDIVGEPISPNEALRLVTEAARTAVKRFVYKPFAIGSDDRPMMGEELSGLIVDYAPRYGSYKDAEHPNGQMLNSITAIGDMMLAITALSDEVKDLRKKLEDLQGD